MNNEWTSVRYATTTLRRMRVRTERIVYSIALSLSLSLLSRSFFVVLFLPPPLFPFPISLSLFLLDILSFLLTRSHLPSSSVRTRKCVRRSHETHILITNSRSRGLLPCLVVTPNPIFQPNGESRPRARWSVRECERAIRAWSYTMSLRENDALSTDNKFQFKFQIFLANLNKNREFRKSDFYLDLILAIKIFL